MFAARLLIIAAAAAAVGAQQQPAALDSRLNRGVRLDDSRVELRSQDAAGICEADQITVKHQHTVKESQADRDEMLRQVLSGAAVQLRPAASPDLRSANSTNRSIITLVHPDDNKRVPFEQCFPKSIWGKTFENASNDLPTYCKYVGKTLETRSEESFNSFQKYCKDKCNLGKPNRRLNKTKVGTLAHHVPLAFASEERLKNWTVFTFEMIWLDQPKDLLENPELKQRFVNRMV